LTQPSPKLDPLSGETIRFQMDLPNPTSFPYKQLDVTDDVTVCISRVKLGREELIPNYRRKKMVSSLYGCNNKRCNHDSGTPGTCNSNEQSKKIIRAEASRKYIDPLDSAVDPLRTYISTEFSELENLSCLPNSSSDFSKRAQQTEIAAILSQAVVVGFQMGTSSIEGKPTSQARRRHQRRNSVLYRSQPEVNDTS
jgi:hypothetical protein